MLNQFAALSLKDQASTLKALRAAYADNRLAAKADRENQKAAKAEAKAAKAAAAIAKAQARLQKLLDKANPVGTAARKASKRPSKAVVTYGAEANAIAAAIMSKKASA